jgi:pyruvate-formate lyase-activating enzyme
MNQRQRIFEIKNITNQVSKTFCLAKWHHTTIYLQTGETHSCYHPSPHKIQLHEIAATPAALHNTAEKKNQRKQMLDGEKPGGCQYCWNIESMGDDYISDRLERNASIYTVERMTEITQNNWDYDINPEYVEVSFGSECNFKCGYCHPKHSSSYYKEIKDHGPYTMVKNHRNDIDWFKTYEEDSNPYVDAWWQWWPTMSKTLNILRITGGEPLLQQSTWRLLEDLDQNPLPNLELNINSNLGVKPILVQRLSEKVERLKTQGKIKSFKLFTSLDTWGERAEYIRTGLNLATWESNFKYYLNNTTCPVTFMITFNVLTVTTFKSLLEKILEWRSEYHWKEHPSDDIKHRIRFDTPHLKEPLQYDMNILPKQEFMPYMHSTLEYIKLNIDDSQYDKFSEMEYEKFRRVVDYMENTTYSDQRLAEGMKDFYNWFNEYDIRRGTDFLETFPEYKNFYDMCKKYA